MITEFKVDRKVVNKQTGEEYYVIVDDFANEAYIRCSYIGGDIPIGSICRWKMTPAIFENRAYIRYKFLGIVKKG